MSHHFISQGHAEDVILWYRYNYYVNGLSLIADGAYDLLEREVLQRWPVSIIADLGADLVESYPSYIREHRRPNHLEREDRDRTIVERWVNAL